MVRSRVSRGGTCTETFEILARTHEGYEAENDRNRQQIARPGRSIKRPLGYEDDTINRKMRTGLPSCHPGDIKTHSKKKKSKPPPYNDVKRKKIHHIPYALFG